MPKSNEKAGSENSLTAYVAGFITRTRAADIPADVTHLGKRSILDGLGLALAGNAAESGHIVRTLSAVARLPPAQGRTDHRHAA